jgi:phenylpropionate dioxygenase-like ring-hydroxylating dioxygenase large terminal subunit
MSSAADPALPPDPAATDAWYAVARIADVDELPVATRLLGRPIHIGRDGAGEISVRDQDGVRLAVTLAFGHVFASPGAPPDLFPIPEFEEADRRLAACGAVLVRSSGLRLIENFLDMAHFPFVHGNLLGTVDRPEVPPYEVEFRRDVDEVWATRCRFWQPQAAAHAEGGQMSEYAYRVVTPFNVLLYKSSPSDPQRNDVIGLFVQPLEEDLCAAFTFVLVIDDVSTMAELLSFQQTIFVQDRIIVENQRPRLLPLSPRAETPTRADLSSVAYRRWLKEKGLRFGVLEKHRAPPP